MPDSPRVAIVDYGMGNLFSVKHACAKVGLDSTITSKREDIARADGIILPGIGAFGDAMSTLRELGLVDLLKEAAHSAKPMFGICLGMQLLMQRSYEFGSHEGLGIVPGRVVRFESPSQGSLRLKIPQVCWNSLHAPLASNEGHWDGSILDQLSDGVLLYFVHSYYVQVESASFELARTRYGDVEFCSAVRYGNVYACQAHPERSGTQGLAIYANFARIVRLGAA